MNNFPSFVLALMVAIAPQALAQAQHVHPAAKDTASTHQGHDMSGHDMSDHDMAGHGHAMSGMYGPYAMTREASGTAWQPDAGSHSGLHLMRGSWMVMLHGAVDLVRTQQGGKRGDDKVFANDMVMAMAQRPLGRGNLGLRLMLSLEPSTIGDGGYPLLLQTGETADGISHLIDRQHPHDFFMELAGTYSVSSGNRSLFVYAGLPGEPALGPPAFMHRFSGAEIPEAPIAHHWLDSTHITFGVLTAGAVVDRLKIEVSGFHGREPDQHRWNIETPKLDSHSFRVSFNPTPSWSMQASHGRLHSVEQLAPDVDTDRTTVSAMHARAWEGGRWESTLAWGRNRNRPGRILDAFSVESAARFQDAHTLVGRLERVEKDELFDHDDPLHGRAFYVGKVSLGYRHDFWRTQHLAAGLGVLGTVAMLPSRLVDAYGSRPTSGLIFGRLELR